MDEFFKTIIARRDPRYDGRFYFGVKTTGIYCRPVCPAKPKPENVVIFRSASEAERAGYRACLRCHPDLAPGMKMPQASDPLMARALKQIQILSTEELAIPKLAQTLGVTDRHVRRLFDQYLGASPIEILITQRLHLAKQMIQETTQPLTDVALAAGFQSIRRFNEAFKERYRTSPSTFRKKGVTRAAGPLTLRIPIRLPYDGTTVLAYLKRHEAYGLEHVEKNQYVRYIVHEKKIGLITVTHQPGHAYLIAAFLDIPLSHVRALLARVKNLFDTDHNPLHLPKGRRSMAKGIRVPCSFDPFETAISIILAQGVSTEHARLALKKLICRFGRRVGIYREREVFEFPSARQLAQADSAGIGLPKARARAIQELARHVHKKRIDFNAPGDLAGIKNRLLEIHGIGPWTATMVAMRCLNDSDAFSRAYLTHMLWRNANRQKENVL